MPWLPSSGCEPSETGDGITRTVDSLSPTRASFGLGALCHEWRFHMDREGSATLNRREWLQLVGTGAGLGMLGGLVDERLLIAAGQGAARAKVTFPRGAIVRTILKDLPPDALAGGATLFHEHLSINLSVLGGRNAPALATPPPPPATDDVELMVQLVNKAGTEGVSCIVDGGHTDMGRKMADLKTIASRTKVHIVAAGGL